VTVTSGAEVETTVTCVAVLEVAFVWVDAVDVTVIGGTGTPEPATDPDADIATEIPRDAAWFGPAATVPDAVVATATAIAAVVARPTCPEALVATVSVSAAVVDVPRVPAADVATVSVSAAA
jgi:hypothetical protein